MYGLLSQQVRRTLGAPLAPNTVRMASVLRSYASVMKYTKEHEWLRIEDDQATIGITDYAQNSLGDLVYIEMPEVGATFEQSDDMGVVESVKAASDVYAPISGVILEVNEKAAATPSIINKEAETNGWLVKMKITEPNQLTALLDAETYASFCKED
ncbi:glycine cleavage system H protein [Sphaeroforma arctica JP610]|uniref:Glycine cleavage system H protein n=1 Tax=Sphaeroforma arctica JP610 TaxID=667725 RepID=A0A0L0G8P9_9EUKA|nr:glycine cleavage system H protein [Sphaeroforma arctica JP610]KNC85289.1 glycine cleavage system H protein [Sphaeroforma arctica JP610]|eukprot:XP_014159191.1 glycine cleavage system H protein [Sphaeroforma arctica JP610]